MKLTDNIKCSIYIYIYMYITVNVRRALPS